MSISPIMKGNAPLMHFSFVTDSGGIVALPISTAQIAVWIHDTVSVRVGQGTLQNLNAIAGTVDYVASNLDTANAGLATWWMKALLPGESVARDFDPQKIYIEDPSQG